MTAIEEALTIMMVSYQPRLAGKVHITRHARATYTYHAHRSNPRLVIVKTSLSLNRPRDLMIVADMAHAAVECLEGRTSAVALGMDLGR